MSSTAMSGHDTAPHPGNQYTVPALFSCSPRSGGNSDQAVEYFSTGIQQAGGLCRIYYLRDFALNPCLGCLRCDQDPRGECYQSSLDQSAPLFQALLSAPMIFISAPIYFYHVPAHFKAWIDRSQCYYLRREKGDPALTALPPRKAVINLVAGRQQGEKLFAGALLTIKYFLRTFNFSIQEHHIFRGVDAPKDLLMNETAQQALTSAGKQAWSAPHP
jgi:multimeric flavodoxin WrbA